MSLEVNVNGYNPVNFLVMMFEHRKMNVLGVLVDARKLLTTGFFGIVKYLLCIVEIFM